MLTVTDARRDTGFLKDRDGRDIIALPDQDGKRIVFDRRVANCSCYVSQDGRKAVIGTLWGNVILNIPDKEEGNAISGGSDRNG